MVVIASTFWDRLSESGSWTIPEKMLRTAVVYLAIVILLRLFGKRELAQLNSFDLVVLLLLSNVVQNAIIGPDTSLWGGLVGAATLLFLNMVVVRVVKRFPRIDRLFEGQKNAIVIDGKYDEKELNRLGLRHGDVDSAIRRQGASSIDEVERASIYPGGAIVVQLNEEDENATRGDVERLERKIEQLIAPRTLSVWFGLFLPQLRMSFGTILERTLAAEAAGFDSVWLMDHLAAPAAPEQDTFEGWTLAAALAVRTTTIRIGHLVTCDPFRHPAVLAKMAATVDVLSDGRLELGIGWGSVERELETFGIGAGPASARAARMRETIEILDLMFAGESFDYAGHEHQLHGAIGRPRPVQQPRPPLHIGGAGPRLTMPIVRDHADWWNCPTYAVDRLAELRPLAGDARVSVQHPIGLASSAADRDETVAVAQRRFGTWGGLIAGTANEVADGLAAEAATGVEGFVVQLTDFGHPETIARFMSDVAPVVARA